MDAFDKRKEAILSGIISSDKSVKASIDYDCLPFVHLLNSHPDYVSTSSCSGRISVMSEAYGGSEEEIPDTASSDVLARGKGGRWLYVSHEAETVSAIISQLPRNHAKSIDEADYARPMIYFKFEPFIMHVEARTIEAGRRLMGIGLQCGFRNSGLTLSSNGRVMIAFRLTMKMDVPIGFVDYSGNEVLFVTDAYLGLLVAQANEKFERNRQKYLHLLRTMKKALTELQESEKGRSESREDRAARKRREGLQRQASLRGSTISMADFDLSIV